MLKRLKQRWQEFRRGRPGHRFQERYERNREAEGRRSGVSRFLKPVVGVVLLVAGVVFCLIPGPGLPLVLIGAAMLADVSLRVARALDGMEVRGREIASRVCQWWRREGSSTE